MSKICTIYIYSRARTPFWPNEQESRCRFGSLEKREGQAEKQRALEMSIRGFQDFLACIERYDAVLHMS